MTEVAGSSDPRTAGRRSTLQPVTVLFALAAFTGAGLLFVVQPMIARLLLPSFGGSSTVWSTSSLFFQVLLLLGYLYAHFSTTRLGRTWQPRVHLLVLLLPLVTLPIALPADAAPEGDTSPVWWLLRTLMIVIGLPFVVVSTTGPLLQRWYSWTDGHRSDDPYFLFAASNLGSFGGLLAYPFLVEPLLDLDQQRALWSIGFGVFVVLTAACGVVANRSRDPLESQPESESLDLGSLDRARIARWMAWAFLPSALMLAVTSHVTTDVAAIPLLWVIPLAIYLATFVAAFARTSRQVPVLATRLAVALGLAAALGSVVPVGLPVPQVLIQMVMLASVGYAVHARLAADRPDPAHLTAYYLVIATGGALGGLLNGVVAPTVFDRVLEYPLIMLCIPLLMLGVPARQPLDDDARRQLVRKVRLALWAVLGAVLLFVGMYFATGNTWWLIWPVITGLAAALGYRLAREPKLLIVALALVFGTISVVNQVRAVDMSRTFYGSYQVVETDGQHLLVHGTTVHGIQFLDERSVDPAGYYVENGPLGDIFATRDFEEIGVIGLGAGGIAAYGQAGTRMTYYEIDQEVVRIARDPELFSYLEDTEAEVETVVGDGRLKLADEPDQKFDLLILDAFSSDAIPIHLLTVEALETYASKLREGGVLVLHISSRVFDLERVVAGASDALGWDGLQKTGGSGEGSLRSQWAVLTTNEEFLDGMSAEKDWEPLTDDSVTWTDNYSSIIDVLRW